MDNHSATICQVFREQDLTRGASLPHKTCERSKTRTHFVVMVLTCDQILGDGEMSFSLFLVFAILISLSVMSFLITCV